MNPILAELGGYPLAAFQDLKRAMADEAEPLHDFSIGDPIEPTPQFIRDALIAAVPATSQYPTAAGLRKLRVAVADWVERRFKVQVDPDTEVLPTAGSKEGIFHLPLGVLDPGAQRTGVLWGTPGYPVYGRGQRFAGGHSDPVALTAETGWRLDLGALERARLDDERGDASGAEIVADAARVILQRLLLDDIEHREPDRARHGVAAERRQRAGRVPPRP